MYQKWWYGIFSFLISVCVVMSDLILVFSGVVFLEKLMLLVFLYVVGFALFQFRDPIDVVMELSETLST